MARAARRKAPPATGQLQMQVDAIAAASPPRPQPAAPPVPAAPVPRTIDVEDRYTPVREPFGAWLVKQQTDGSNEMRSLLVRGAKADPRFPKSADPDQVRKYLGERGGADGDVFEAIDDAENDWLCL